MCVSLKSIKFYSSFWFLRVCNIVNDNDILFTSGVQKCFYRIFNFKKLLSNKFKALWSFIWNSNRYFNRQECINVFLWESSLPLLTCNQDCIIIKITVCILLVVPIFHHIGCDKCSRRIKEFLIFFYFGIPLKLYSQIINYFVPIIVI